MAEPLIDTRRAAELLLVAARKVSSDRKYLDSHVEALARELKQWWSSIASAIDDHELTQAVENRNRFSIDHIVYTAVRRARVGAQERVHSRLTDALAASAAHALPDLHRRTAARQVTRSLGQATELRAAAPFTFNFDKTNPRAQAFALRESSKLITEVGQETIKAVQELIEQAFEEGIPPEELKYQIKQIVGLRSDQISALQKFAEGDVTEFEIDRYWNELLNDRALLIARTEVNRSANAGQTELWKQAEDEGLLPPGTKRMWIATMIDDDTPDPRTREEHAEMHGQIRGLDEPFTKRDGTPIEPGEETNCRCSEGIASDADIEAYYERGSDWLTLAAGESKIRPLGGPGSGNFGHLGRPGQVGGSAPSDGGGYSDGGLVIHNFDSSDDGIPAGIKLDKSLSSSIEDMHRGGNWKLKLVSKDDSRGMEFEIVPRHLPPRIIEGGGMSWRGKNDGWYDPELAYLNEKGEAVPKPEAGGEFPLKSADAEPGVLYRGMSTAEWEEIQRSGEIRSVGSFNLGGAQEGKTYFSTDPEVAKIYAAGFTPWQYTPTFDRPAIVIAVRDPGTNVVEATTGGSERAIPGAIPRSDILSVYEGRVYQVRPGNVQFYERIRGEYHEGSRGAPGESSVWRRIEHHRALGGPGSGNFGHMGRPGQVGGSAPADSGGGGEYTSRNIDKNFVAIPRPKTHVGAKYEKRLQEERDKLAKGITIAGGKLAAIPDVKMTEDSMVENMESLFAQANADDMSKEHWYRDNAGKLVSDFHDRFKDQIPGLTVDQVTAVVACASPNSEWDKDYGTPDQKGTSNQVIAERVLTAWAENREITIDADQLKLAWKYADEHVSFDDVQFPDRVGVYTFRELAEMHPLTAVMFNTPFNDEEKSFGFGGLYTSVVPGLRVLMGEDPSDSMSKDSAKVRSFYTNISKAMNGDDNDSDVTIDIHMGRALTGNHSLEGPHYGGFIGSTARYELYRRAVVRAAKLHSMTPRSYQAIVWHVVRHQNAEITTIERRGPRAAKAAVKDMRKAT